MVVLSNFLVGAICETFHDVSPETQENPTPITLTMVKEAIELDKETKDYPHLQGLITTAFSCVEALNASFPLGLTKLSYSRPSINYPDIASFYSLISELPSTEPAMLMLSSALNLLKRPKRKLSLPSDIYFLLIILENPALYSASIFTASHSETSLNSLSYHVLERCIAILAHSPKRTRHYLLNWLSRFPTSQFQQKVELLNSYIAHRLARYNVKSEHQQKHNRSLSLVDSNLIPSLHDLPPPSATSYDGLTASAPSTQYVFELPHLRTPHHEKKSKPTQVKIKVSQYGRDWRIFAFASLHAIFFNANAISTKVPISLFYNSMVDCIDFKADFEAWERLGVPTSLLQTNSHVPSITHSTPNVSKLNPLDAAGYMEQAPLFAFCQFPFLLSVGTKIFILEYDARRQKQYQVHEAFFSSLSSLVPSQPYLHIKVSRENLLQDSFDFFETHEDELKKAIRVEFVGEAGIDAGGLKKEWFLLLVRELFDPARGLFAEDEESKYCWFNISSTQPLKFYKLTGVALGLALYNSTNLDIHFPPAMFKRLLGSSYNLKDFTEMWPQFGRSLQNLLDYEGDDFENTFCLTFSVTRKLDGDSGDFSEEPLIANGQYRTVTKANRADYVKRVVAYYMEGSVKRQFEPLKQGFYKVVGSNALSLFRPEEIELLIRGSSDEEELDIPTLRAVTQYKHWEPYYKTAALAAEKAPVVNWFWQYFETIEPLNQRKLLMFVTGSDRIPATGISTLTFKLTRLGDDCDRFPVSHTCFNELCLYEYKSKYKLIQLLTRAINESEGFGLR